MSQAILEEITKDQPTDDRADFKVGMAFAFILRSKKAIRLVSRSLRVYYLRRGGGIKKHSLCVVSHRVLVWESFPTQPVDRKSRSTASRSPCVPVCFTCVIALVRPLIKLRKSGSSKQDLNRQFTITFKRPTRRGGFYCVRGRINNDLTIINTRLHMQSDDDLQTTLSKWPFILGDVLLVATALAIAILGDWQLSTWQVVSKISGCASGTFHTLRHRVSGARPRRGGGSDRRYSCLTATYCHCAAASRRSGRTWSFEAGLSNPAHAQQPDSAVPAQPLEEIIDPLCKEQPSNPFS